MPAPPIDAAEAEREPTLEVEPSLQDATDLSKDKGYKVYTGEGRTGQLAGA